MVVGLLGGGCRVRRMLLLPLFCCWGLLVSLRWSTGSTRLFSCESAKVANNFAEISWESHFQLSSNRLALSNYNAKRMDECTKTNLYPGSYMYIEQGYRSAFAFKQCLICILIDQLATILMRCMRSDQGKLISVYPKIRYIRVERSARY